MASPRAQEASTDKAPDTLGLLQAVRVAGIEAESYRDDIDQWIEASEQQAAGAHAAWSAGQDAIRP